MVKKTKHTKTTADGKTTHKTLGSNPFLFQPSKKTEEARKPPKRCIRCDRFSNDEICDTHKRIMTENKKQDEQINQQTSSSKTFPTMPARETKEIPDMTIISDGQSSKAEETPTTANADSEITVTVEITYNNGNERKPTEVSPDNQMPAISLPVGCSTERTQRRIAKGSDPTPTRSP